MGKGKYGFAYDPVAAFRNAPKLMGMELRECGPNKMCGSYYLNGDAHQYRRDKLKVFISRGSVWVAEEGGKCVSLPQWLIEFGGAADYREALGIIKGENQSLNWAEHSVRVKESVLKYVGRDALEGAMQYDLRKCALFRWMCTMFPEERVREVWKRYNVTTDSHGNAVFWYVDQNERILFDKRIYYKEDGHRDKSFFPGRKYRVADGYSGRCYFGACIPDDGKKAFICESEKSALLASLYYGGRRFLATGGKGNLREVEPNEMLVPDLDARIEWEDKGEVWPWWEKWGIAFDQMPQTADIGDMIVWKVCASGK
jgi:hypothetical protein